VFSKEIKVDIKRKDRYGRHVGKIYVQAVYINLEMVRAGLAWHYKQYAKKDTDLATAEQEAREAKRGLWQAATQVAPWEYRKVKKSRKRSYIAKK
jgi:endonuclease YncB( thermonuclease family)